MKKPKKKMYKAVVFDFDYTLGDSTNGIVISVNYALNKLGYDEKSADAIRKTIGLSLKDTFVFLTGKNNETDSALFAGYFKEKADSVMVENTALYEGVLKSLAALRERGYKLCIVTTKFHYRIEQILRKYDAVSFIDLIVGAEDVKIEKPNPEGLLWVIKNLGLDKKHILYVGDSLVDAKTAHNAGVDFAAVLTGTTTKDDFLQYENVFVEKDINAICKNILAGN